MSKAQVLDQMGVQRWQLRQAASTELKHACESEKLKSTLDANIQSLEETELTTDLSSKNSPSQNDIGEPDKKLNWQELEERVLTKTHCESCKRLSSILGEGERNADWVFAVDAPTQRDVQQGQLLSGREGQLFNAILQALNLDRSAIYLSSIFKCPPSEDRSLLAQCGDLIHQQIELINPTVVLAFGEFASQALLRSNHDLDELRKTTNLTADNKIAVIGTYGLREMLDQPSLKAAVWQDLKKGLQLF